MGKSKRKNGTGKVYKTGRLSYWGLVVFIVVIMGAILAEMYSTPNQTILWILLLPIAYMVISKILIEAGQHITLYEDGLECRRRNSRLFVEWHEMNHLGRKGSGKHKSYGIFLKHTIQSDSTSIVDKLFFDWSSDYINLSPIVKVPTRRGNSWTGSTVDLDKFAQTEFGRDLKHYAPHLF